MHDPEQLPSAVLTDAADASDATSVQRPPTAADTVASVGRRVDVLGVHVSVTNPDATLWQISDWIRSNARQYVCVSDVNALLNASCDGELRHFYNHSGLTLADGMPLVWAGKVAGFDDMERVCGPDLLPKVLQASAHLGWRNYFLGGAAGVAQRLADLMVDRYPGLEIAGVECPPFRELSRVEKDDMVARIDGSRADIVWIGLGAPKQERWMAEFRPRLKAAVLIGVGAAFNFHAGEVKRAPKVLQNAGLEWAYRVTQEPGRLSRRYAVAIPKFLTGIARNRPHPV